MTQDYLGEQFGGDRRDAVHYEEWVERWGHPAKDLTWSYAMYVVLMIAIDEAEVAATLGAVNRSHEARP